MKTSPVETHSFSDPKVAAAALAAGGHLVRVEESSGRLLFVVAGLPEDFFQQLVNNVVHVPARSFIEGLDTLLGLIAERRRARW